MCMREQITITISSLSCTITAWGGGEGEKEEEEEEVFLCDFFYKHAVGWTDKNWCTGTNGQGITRDEKQCTDHLYRNTNPIDPRGYKLKEDAFICCWSKKRRVEQSNKNWLVLLSDGELFFTPTLYI